MPYSNPDKQREYQRNWRAKRREDFFDGKVCVRCGSSSNLELDHIDRETKHPSLVGGGCSPIWGWSETRRREELAKCQVLCHACHLVKTVEEDMRHQTTHGEIQMYRLGCRCALCKDRKRKSNAQRKKHGPP